MLLELNKSQSLKSQRCAYVHVCEHAYGVCTCVGTSTCTLGPEGVLCLLPFSVLYPLRQGLLLNLEFTVFDKVRTAGSKAQHPHWA